MQLSICCVCCLFLEDAVHRDFKVLPKGFMSIVLESFLPCSSKRNLFPHGPAKVAELGCELSFLGFECIARGAMYEAYMHSPVHYEAIQKNLLHSKSIFGDNFFLQAWWHVDYLHGYIIVLKHLFVGLDSQRLAGKLAHLKLEINPMILTAPSPVSHFPVLYLLRNNRIKIFRLIVCAVASEAHSIL